MAGTKSARISSHPNPSTTLNDNNEYQRLHQAIQALKAVLPQHVLATYSTGRFNDLIVATNLFIKNLINTEPVSEYHENHDETKSKSVGEKLRFIIPVRYLVAEKDGRTRRDILHEAVNTAVWRRDTLLAAIRYINVLRLEKSAAPKTNPSTAGPEVGDVTANRQQPDAKKSTRKDESLDGVMTPGQLVTSKFIATSIVRPGTIEQLRKNKRGVIISAAGVWSDRKRYLCQIINQIWALPLEGVGAGYAHKNEWVAVMFSSTEAREVAYRALSNTTFFSHDRAIRSINIRRFDDFGVQQATEETVQSLPENQADEGDVEKSPDGSLCDQEASDVAVTEPANENEEPLVGGELRRKERKLLSRIIPESFQPKAKMKATLKILHAATCYIKSLNGDNIRPLDNELPVDKDLGMLSLRNVVPRSYVNKFRGTLDETQLFIAARSYINDLTEQRRCQEAATEKTKDAGLTAASTQAIEVDHLIDDSTERNDETRKRPSAKKRRQSTVELTTPPAAKVRKHSGPVTTTAKGKFRSIHDEAVAIETLEDPVAPRIPFRPSIEPIRWLSRNPQNSPRITRPDTTAASAKKPRAATEVAETSSEASPASTGSASNPSDAVATAENSASAVLADLDRLDDIVRERRKENIEERKLNKLHSTRGANALVSNARDLVNEQAAKIAELEREGKGLKRRVRMLEEAAAKFE